MDKNTYTLTVAERLVLSGILPPEGDIVTLGVVRKLREALTFSEEEIQQLKFRQAGQVHPDDDSLPLEKQRRVAPDTLAWVASADPLKTFSFGRATLEIIRGTLKQLNEAKKLREEHVSLYEIFVGAEEVSL